MRTLEFSVQFLWKMYIISTNISYKKTIRHLPQFFMVNDEQYDSPQQKVENEGQPQGMITQERMQAEEQTEERSRGYGGRTEHRLRLGDAYKDAIEDECRHARQRNQHSPPEIFARCSYHLLIAREQREEILATHYI